MPLPSSGQISFSQLACELGNACSNVGLRAYSLAASLSTPDSISELYGKRCYENFLGAWSNGGNLPTDKWWHGSSGTQNASLAFGGYNTSPYKETVQYDGTTWSSKNNMLVGRIWLRGLGSTNSTISLHYDCTEFFNGTNWANCSGLLTSREQATGAGDTTAGLASGGYPSVTCVESYNGTNWSTKNGLSIGRDEHAGFGIQNAALVIGGRDRNFNYPNSVIRTTEAFNGTNWSTCSDMLSRIYCHTGAGTTNAGIVFSGRAIDLADPSNLSHKFNGSTWYSSENLVNSKVAAGAAHSGTQSSTLISGGQDSSSGCIQTQEYTATTSDKRLI